MMDAETDSDPPPPPVSKGRNPYLTDTCLLCRCKRPESAESSNGKDPIYPFNLLGIEIYITYYRRLIVRYHEINLSKKYFPHISRNIFIGAGLVNCKIIS